jgi:hypothetical protein
MGPLNFIRNQAMYARVGQLEAVALVHYSDQISLKIVTSFWQRMPLIGADFDGRLPRFHWRTTGTAELKR